MAGGIVAYANEAKIELLGVDPGADRAPRRGVAEVAEAMADGALERFGADVAIAITGIAGPDGGTEEKPVGTVCWCAKRGDGATLARDVRMPGDRNEVRDRSTTVGMHLLRRLLRGEEFPVCGCSWRSTCRDHVRAALGGSDKLHVTLVFLGGGSG